jgi:integrase/recombinase XerD
MAEKQVYNRFYTDEKWERVNKENKDIMEDYLEELKSKKYKQSTIVQYTYDLKYIFIYVLDELKNKVITELSKKDFRRFVLWCQDKDMSSARINRLKASVGSLLQFVEDDDDYEDYNVNQAKRVKGQPKEEVRDKESYFMTFEQCMKIREYLVNKEDWQMASLLMVAWDSAGRRNEIHQINKECFTKGLVSNQVIGKRGKKFNLYIMPDTQELILKWLEVRGEDSVDSLWVINGEEMKYDTMYTRFVMFGKFLSEIEGKEIHTFSHMFRHSRLQSLMEGTDTRLGNKKFTIEELMILANHSSSETTQNYVLKDNKDTINNLFGVVVK